MEIEYQHIPPPCPLIRSLSHIEMSYDKASLYFDQCNEGDTIFTNYFTNKKGWTTFTYLQKTNGEMVEYFFEMQEKDVPTNWTFDVCDFKFRGNIKLNI